MSGTGGRTNRHQRRPSRSGNMSVIANRHQRRPSVSVKFDYDDVALHVHLPVMISIQGQYRSPDLPPSSATVVPPAAPRETTPKPEPDEDKKQ
ncbi:hypothetical protein Ddye_028312 [Dipteronia dyeriana]|uniref:Uncharacterized protein n=1 Tax=Dipteronia dyeriana TaxID=168575 RepID=A0AAD9WS78_9ROSI|nr:hypothetical protein Ddye_028312 [Dipteronia dyeriana]